MNNRYLIPANTKKSLLYFGLFNKFDALLFGSGLLVSLLMVSFMPAGNITITVIALLPAAITGFLVLPVPYYYNMRTILRSIVIFYTTRQKFVWKGWCIHDGESGKK